MKLEIGTLPPQSERSVVGLHGPELGDEGSTLIGKCVQLRTWGSVHVDANDERMKCLASLNRLSSLVVDGLSRT